MIQWTDELKRQFKVITIFNLAMLVAAPLLYLAVGYFVNPTVQQGGEQDMMFYILFIVALVVPLLIPIINKSQVKIYKKNEKSQGSPVGFFTMMSIQKAVLIEAVYIFGLVVYFLSGDFMRMLWFYPVGVIYTLFYFPRKAHFEKFMEKIESYETKD